MICPHCKTENRDDRAACYHCSADLKLLRSAVNASKHHFNHALDHAGRGRNAEAIADCRAALKLDASFVSAWVVLGTLHAKEEQFAEAEAAWQQALKIDERYGKAHDYLTKLDRVKPAFPAFQRLRRVTVVLILLVGLGMLAGVGALLFSPSVAGNLSKLAKAETPEDAGKLIALLVLALPLGVAVIARFIASSKESMREFRGFFRDR